MSLGGRSRIETNRQMRRLLFVDQIEQRIGKPELCIGIFAGRGQPWTADQSIIGPEHQRKRIEQKNPFIHWAKVRFAGENPTVS